MKHMCAVCWKSEMCCLIQSPASSLIVTCETEPLISLKQCLQLMVTKDAGVSLLGAVGSVRLPSLTTDNIG